MKPFMDADFLLQTDTAKILYHEAAEKMPIFDYHNHLNPQEILEDRQMENLTRVWLGRDHYKWRAMRAMGFSEDLITGNADDYDKYLAFAETIENAIGNPLYHWTHLELQRYSASRHRSPAQQRRRSGMRRMQNCRRRSLPCAI